MIEPQKAVFLYGGEMIIVCENGNCWKYDQKLRGSHGACFTGWKDMTDEEVYRAMDWLAIEFAEFSEIPIRRVRDAMIDNVRGYREYQNRSGRLALGGKREF